MPFIFRIRPVAIETGFDLSCEGVLPNDVRHRRLVDAIAQARRVGSDLDGEIQVFDVEGRIADVFPLRAGIDRSDALQMAELTFRVSCPHTTAD